MAPVWDQIVTDLPLLQTSQWPGNFYLGPRRSAAAVVIKPNTISTAMGGVGSLQLIQRRQLQCASNPRQNSYPVNRVTIGSSHRALAMLGLCFHG